MRLYSVSELPIKCTKTHSAEKKAPCDITKGKIPHHYLSQVVFFGGIINHVTLKMGMMEELAVACVLPFVWTI